MRIISRWVVGVALLVGILLVMLPKRDEQSLAKIASTSMLMCTADFRAQVAQQLIRKETVSAEFINKCQDLIAALEVSERGEVVITGKKYHLKVALTPIAEDGKVRWSCHGEPASAMTRLCKP